MATKPDNHPRLPNSTLEIQRGRRGIDRIAPEDHQHFHMPAVQVPGEFFDRVGVFGFDTIQQVNGRPYISQGSVDSMGGQMHAFRLKLAGNDHAPAFSVLQVLRDRVQPLRRGCAEIRHGGHTTGFR